MEGNTYRTIVIEQFKDDEDTPNLATKLTGVNNISPELSDDIAKELTVHSFKEFLDKFLPDIYEVPVSDTEIQYTLTPPKGRGLTPIKITEHAYYRMIEQCYKQKGKSGQSNLQFDDRAILEMLLPEEEIKETRRLRKLLKEDLRKIQEAETTGESSAVYEDRLQESMDKVNRMIHGSSVLRMLPLAIDDSERKIQAYDRQLAAAEASPDGKALPPAGGTLEFDADGRIVFQEIAPSETVASLPEASQGMTVAGLIESDYESEVGDAGNPYAKQLFLSVYAPKDIQVVRQELVDVREIEDAKQAETQQLHAYQNLYRNARKSFIEQMSAIVSKILGMRVLFDHATVKGGLNGYLSDGILIANCKVRDLLENDGFQKYAEYMGRGQVAKNKMWFAVIPNVQDQYSASASANAGAPKRKFNVKDFLHGGNAAQAKEEAQEDCSATLAELRTAIDILGSAKIMTFFSFHGSNKNGFGTLTAQYISDRKEWFKGMKGADHASYVYPNFTVVRERTVPLATKEQQRRFQAMGFDDDGMKLHVPAVYIDAAYPAAGLMIASQQPDCLRAKGLSVDLTLPCVRVNPATPELRPYLMTKFNRENLLQWNEDVLRAIKVDGFGFVFSSDTLHVDGKRLENTYVLCADTLATDEEGRYIPIEHKMLEDYVWCLYKGSDQTVRGLENMAKEKTREWHTAARHPENVNLMLRNDEESIVFEREEGAAPKIHIKLGKADVYVDNLDVSVE